MTSLVIFNKATRDIKVISLFGRCVIPLSCVTLRPEVISLELQIDISVMALSIQKSLSLSSAKSDIAVMSIWRPK